MKMILISCPPSCPLCAVPEGMLVVSKSSWAAVQPDNDVFESPAVEDAYRPLWSFHS
jgi:hypothetical protein